MQAPTSRSKLSQAPGPARHGSPGAHLMSGERHSGREAEARTLKRFREWPVLSQKARVCTVGAPAETVSTRLNPCLLPGGDRDPGSGPQKVSREEPGEEVLGCVNSIHPGIQGPGGCVVSGS